MLIFTLPIMSKCLIIYGIYAYVVGILLVRIRKTKLKKIITVLSS